MATTPQGSTSVRANAAVQLASDCGFGAYRRTLLRSPKSDNVAGVRAGDDSSAARDGDTANGGPVKVLACTLMGVFPPRVLRGLRLRIAASDVTVPPRQRTLAARP